MPDYTVDKLKAMTVAQRWQLYQNARKAVHNGGAQAAAGKTVLEQIEASGLQYYTGGGLSEDDPVFLKIREVVYSEAGKEAALAAVRAGSPAVCGVDRLLRNELGEEYGKHDLGTSNAGYLVAQLMREIGYEEAGSGRCPPECVARTGMKWKLKGSRRRIEP